MCFTQDDTEDTTPPGPIPVHTGASSSTGLPSLMKFDALTNKDKLRGETCLERPAVGEEEAWE